MSAMISAFRVLTDPANTGAVCIAMPQDVEGEAYDYPVSFFAKRVWRLERRPATEAALNDAAEVIKKAKRPMLVCGGGVRYSEAHAEFRAFAEATGIPFGETQAGKSAIEWTPPPEPGGLGVTRLLRRQRHRQGRRTWSSAWAPGTPTSPLLQVAVQGHLQVRQHQRV